MRPSPSHPALPWLAALGVMLMWASSFLVIRVAGNDFSPGAMTLLRVSAASIALLPLLLLGRVRAPRSPRLWAAVAGWGIAWFAAYLVVLNAAELFLDAATAAMLVNLAPLIVAVTSGLLLGEGLSVRLLAGVLVAFSGIVLISVGASTGGLSGVGVVLGLVAALLYAGSVLVQKLLLAHVDSTSMTVIGVVAGAVACLPFAPTLVAEVGAAPLGAILGVVYLGLFPTALAFLLWGYALTHTGAGLLSSSSLLVPALTVVMAWLLLSEVPPPLAALGGVLCLAGAGSAVAPAVLGSLRPRRPAVYPGPTSSSSRIEHHPERIPPMPPEPAPRRAPWLLIVDPQRIFAAPDSDWASPFWEQSWPRIQELAAQVGPERTLLSRWLPTADRSTAWGEYFRAWPFADVPAADPLYQLVDGAAALTAHPTVDEPTFGKWGPQLAGIVGPAPQLLVAGVSTDCCVLTTVLAAADAGARLTVVTDACAASSPENGAAALHTMSLFPPQVELRTSADVLTRTTERRDDGDH
ncbi:isochorismatase family protein [Brachybacterium vulturis]|uniref:isochorismatase family protein n=1 Tax=Brachybacterium vulturis TaxID=2017484 RepID=UPI0037352697